MKPVIGIDPGREKCGVAVVSSDTGIIWRQVIATADLVAVINGLWQTYASQVIIIGNGTGSKAAVQSLVQAFIKTTVIVQSVDEYRTTDLAKLRYWQENPPTGWRRLLPTSLQIPPAPVDDYVAVILAERYLEAVANNTV